MKDNNNPLAGVELLRAAAHWSGDRPEYMNDNKSATQIIKEYLQDLGRNPIAEDLFKKLENPPPPFNPQDNV